MRGLRSGQRSSLSALVQLSGKSRLEGRGSSKAKLKGHKHADQIEAHARAIVKLNDVLDKINAALDKLLGQQGNEGI